MVIPSHNCFEYIIPLKQVMLGGVEHDVEVRKIDNRYHCRVFVNGVLNQEAYCFQKNHISFTVRNMLRMEDKCGNISAFATAARERLNQMYKG